MQNTVNRIIEEKLIVVLRGYTYEELKKVTEAIYRGGVRCCEVTFDSLGKTDDERTAANIAGLVREFPDMLVGAGTVLKQSQVALVAAAGGKFIVSPDTNPEVIEKTKQLGLVSIPGAFTPSEATLAHRTGADFVKLFPAGEMKLTYLKALVTPLSHIKFLAVGGISEHNVAEALQMGAWGFGISSGIATPQMAREGAYDEITARAKAYVEAIRRAAK